MFPKTAAQYLERLRDEQACVEQVVQSRWPNGMVCPKCNGRVFWPRRRRFVYQCRACGFDVSPTAGTILQDHRVPIRDWFWTAYRVTTCTRGLSANQLRKELGCTCKTAWRMLHHFRCAMKTEPRRPLEGTVELDETYLSKAAGGECSANSRMVLGAVAVLYPGMARERSGRLHLAIADGGRPYGESIRQFVQEYIDRSAKVKCQRWWDLGHPHDRESTPHIEKALTKLKTWLARTHRNVDPNSLPDYLSEFAFRFHRGETPMKSVETLLKLACNVRSKCG